MPHKLFDTQRSGQKIVDLAGRLDLHILSNDAKLLRPFSDAPSCSQRPNDPVVSTTLPPSQCASSSSHVPGQLRTTPLELLPWPSQRSPFIYNAASLGKPLFQSTSLNPAFVCSFINALLLHSTALVIKFCQPIT